MHEIFLALLVQSPLNRHCDEEGPCSWYPCGHENEHVVLVSFCDVTQLSGNVFTSQLTVRAGHSGTETKIDHEN